MKLHDDMIAVIKAHAAGAIIETKLRRVHEIEYGWIVDTFPEFNFAQREYRVQPGCEYEVEPSVPHTCTCQHVGLLDRGSDGTDVYLSSYNGGGHEDGIWSELTLRFDGPKAAFYRTYRDVKLPKLLSLSDKIGEEYWRRQYYQLLESYNGQKGMLEEPEKYNRMLCKLAEACSDHVLGGEHGWESMDFDQFVSLCRKACANNNRGRTVDDHRDWPNSARE